MVDTNYIYGPKENGIEMCAFVVTYLQNVTCLQNSNSLISNHYNNYSASADDVIEALVGHEVLRRLMMSNIMIDALISSPRFYDRTP